MKKVKQIVEDILCATIFVAIIVLLLILALLNEPNGYYVESETQPNGNNYVWVKE